MKERKLSGRDVSAIIEIMLEGILVRKNAQKTLNWGDLDKNGNGVLKFWRANYNLGNNSHGEIYVKFYFTPKNIEKFHIYGEETYKTSSIKDFFNYLRNF